MVTISRKLMAEFFGTFCLVFAGTGAIVVNELHGMVSHVGIALTFGFIVLAMIYSLGDISGCHLNPAVTLGFFIARRFPSQHVLPYIACQCIGGLFASFSLWLMFPDSDSLGGTQPVGSYVQAFSMEFLLSLILMFVILSVSSGAKEKGLMAGVAIGSVIALEALFGGPISGASMNPARSLAPALIKLKLQSLPIYLLAPVLGTMVAVLICRFIHPTQPNEETNSK